MNKIQLENLDERLRKLETDVEKILLIQDNIQNNYISMYDELKIIKNEIKQLLICERELKTNIDWIMKVKDYTIISGSIGIIIYIAYEILRIIR